MARALPQVSREDLTRLWFQLQGLAQPRGSTKLTKRSFLAHLKTTGGLQLDSVNVVDRAHYLTLWSRFGNYDRKRIDRWAYRDRVAYEYWGHEASLLPIEHLPHGLRRMRTYPFNWEKKPWWPHFKTSPESQRRVMRRLRREGPLESSDFERRPEEKPGKDDMWFPKEDKRSLKLLWHAGKVGVVERRHFRCVYDLRERVLPKVRPATQAAYEDGWLLQGLSGNGIAPERHLVNYFTAPTLAAADRKRVLERNLKKKRCVEVEVPGLRGPWYVLPEHLEALKDAPEPEGTTLLCPFDSFLWQRGRAEELLDFSYRIEIYIPPKKRVFGYYVLPILHEGRLVGRLDPKLHRASAQDEENWLEIRALNLVPGQKADRGLLRGLRTSLEDLATFLGADRYEVPRPWKRKLG